LGLKKYFKIPFLNRKSNTNVNSKYNNQQFLDLMRLGFFRGVSETKAYQIYNTNSAVSDAVDQIASKVADLRPIILNQDGSIEKDHDVITFLRKPNSVQNFGDFMESVSSNYLLNKNAYMQIVGNIEFSPSSIYSLKNTWVSVTETSNSAIYTVDESGLYAFLSGEFKLALDPRVPENRRGRILDSSLLAELTHTKGFDLSFDSIKAVSVLSSIERDVELLDQSNNHNLSLLKKGFNGAGLLSVDTDDQSAFEKFSENIKNKFSGSGNAGSPIVTMGKDINYESFGQTNRDMEYSKSKEMSQSSIYQRYEIPKPLVEGSAQTYDNYMTARSALYDDAVFPLANKIFDTLTEIFQNRGMLEEGQTLTYDTSIIPALQLRRSEELKSLQKSYVLSINELRAIAGKEEVEGGDVILAPGNLLPIANDEFTSDNIDNPEKEFVDILRKNGADDEEIRNYWNGYKTVIRANEKS
jgi:HK97 family phage portal protein